jgi:hypothetical protein
VSRRYGRWHGAAAEARAQEAGAKAQVERRARRLTLALAAALLVGAGVAAWQAVVATRAKHDALDAAAAETEAKETAQAKEAETRAVFDFVEKKVIAAARPKRQEGGLGPEVTLREALTAALPAVEQSFAGQPLTEARLRGSLGGSFYYLGEARLSVEQHERARALYLEHLGPDHADTLRAMSNLANGYEALGRYAEALKLHEETLARRKATLGPEHLDTLTSMNNLAMVYSNYDRHAEALELREKVLALRKAKLGADDPRTLDSMDNLVITYAMRGRIQEALDLCEEAFALRKATFGLAQADTLTTMLNLANCYDELKRYGDALKLREETLPLQKTTLPAGHPHTLWTMHNLANSYAKFDRHAEALKLHEETLALREAKLGPTHPDTLRSLKARAECLVKLDRGAEAVPVIDDCMRRSAGQVVYPKLIPGVLDLRLRHFEKAKDAAGCRTTAEMWEKLQRTDAESLYQAAVCRAVTADVLLKTPGLPDAARQAREEADLAMGWLRKAIAKGYKDVAKLKQNKDLDALSDRADFQELLAELEAGTKNDKK